MPKRIWQRLDYLINPLSGKQILKKAIVSDYRVEMRGIAFLAVILFLWGDVIREDNGAAHKGGTVMKGVEFYTGGGGSSGLFSVNRFRAYPVLGQCRLYFLHDLYEVWS